MKFIHGSFGENRNHRCVWLFCLLLCALFLAVCEPVVAQTTIPAAKGSAAKEAGGFSPG